MNEDDKNSILNLTLHQLSKYDSSSLASMIDPTDSKI